ncbi:hypothetical protein BDF20DRAFT_985459, partial [Mycotypha africana]|uniref:uncharacterized protein n=1 Tax=Mycotypha africana TaxID=64632 RepID=UPI0022FFD11D
RKQIDSGAVGIFITHTLLKRLWRAFIFKAFYFYILYEECNSCAFFVIIVKDNLLIKNDRNSIYKVSRDDNCVHLNWK